MIKYVCMSHVAFYTCMSLHDILKKAQQKPMAMPKTSAGWWLSTKIATVHYIVLPKYKHV